MYLSPKKINAYGRDFDETKYISFLIKDDELLEKYNKILEKFENTLKKGFDTERVYNENYLEAKIKSYNGKINRSFHYNKIPEEVSLCICLSVILIDFVFRTGCNYYPQVFLEECQYVVKEKKIPKDIIDDIEISSNSDIENSHEENSNKENFNEENSDGESQKHKERL